jgi:hypothetical protein
MKKFLVLYKAPIEEFQKMMAKTDKEMQKKGMQEWEKWMKAHKKELADMGAPVGKTKKVTANGVSDTKNDIGGYSIVQASSHEAAAKTMQDNPHFQIPRASIEVMEIMEMPGM